jgi:hypothetical protein
MEILFRIALFIVGIINIIPSILAFLPQKISTSYGIDIPNVNYELLLRHRAILFGIVGGLLLFSAIAKKYYELSIISGLLSMLSFIVLYFIIGHNINNELKKIMIVDVFATILLCIGIIFYYLSLRKPH